MSANGYMLHKELPAYMGFFKELNPQENPITTLAMAKGIRTTPNKEYGLTFHNLPDETSANLKPDNASPTFGSSGFTTGSNTVQIWMEGAAETWARRGDQEQGRLLGWQNPTNPSLEPSAKDRGLAEAMAKIKSQLEWVSREGVFNLAHAGTAAGTTGVYQQRGYRYGDGLTIGTATGAVPGTGTLGTLGTLDYDKVMDTLQTIWDKGNWRSTENMLAVCNSTVKRELTEIFKTEFNFGKNGQLVNESGVNLLRFTTDFGNVDILLTGNFPVNDLYFLNMNHMEVIARPVPGMPNGGIMFETELPNTTAADSSAIYTEMGMNYFSGSFHGRMLGIGSAVIGGQAVS